MPPQNVDVDSAWTTLVKKLVPVSWTEVPPGPLTGVLVPSTSRPSGIVVCMYASEIWSSVAPTDWRSMPATLRDVVLLSLVSLSDAQGYVKQRTPLSLTR